MNYRYWQIPYFWSGCKLYDVLAGSQNMEGSYFMGRGKTLAQFPLLKDEKLRGSLVYYDGKWPVGSNLNTTRSVG
jgi:glycerol-3-phosphate dehydrogenase